MPRILVFILSLIVSVNSYSQTKELEEKSLNDRANNGEITGVRLNTLAGEWHTLLNDFGGYPELPYNTTTNKMDFNLVLEFNGLEKEIIFNRVT